MAHPPRRMTGGPIDSGPGVGGKARRSGIEAIVKNRMVEGGGLLFPTNYKPEADIRLLETKQEGVMGVCGSVVCGRVDPPSKV